MRISKHLQSLEFTTEKFENEDYYLIKFLKSHQDYKTTPELRKKIVKKQDEKNLNLNLGLKNTSRAKIFERSLFECL